MTRLTNIPAPIKGWNTVDAISNMSPEFSLILDNLIPNTASVSSRKGYKAYATSVGSGNVDSIFELSALSVNKMIAAASGNIYDTTVAGTATLLKSGFSNNQWQGSICNAQLGLVNGVDTPQVYDGTTVSNMTVSGPSDVTKLIGMVTFKNRTYFWEINSQNFWYSALNTLGGVLTQFPLSRVGNFGGNLIAIQTVTKDGGSGQDDAICFFMSTGEVIVYEGTDPGSNFVLTGVFRSGRPINSRSIQKFGADIFSVTNQGYITMSSLLPLSFGKTDTDINRYIKGAASSAAATYATSFGWQVIISPTDNILIVNVPQSNNEFVQHVINVNTLGWCRFTGINARCWGVFGNTLYFGGTNGTIYKYGPDYLDNSTEEISYIYQSPYLSLSSGQVRTTAFRPNIRLDGNLSLSVKSSFDFKPFTPSYTVSYSFIGAMWGDPWGSPWATANSIINYLNLNSICYKVSIHLTIETGALLEFYKTDFLFMDSKRI